MRPNQQILFAVALFLSALTALPQEHKREADQTNAAPSRIPDSRNLQDAINKVAQTTADTFAINRDPADINSKAKELKDLGQDLFFQKNRPQEGIEKIEAAIKIDPRMPEAYSTLGLYYMMTKRDFQTAARYSEEGVKHCPKSSSVRYNLGNVYSAMNRPKDALEQYKAALDIGIESKASVLYNIGNEYRNLGKMSDATASWQSALAANDKHLNARRNLAMSYGQSGDMKAARKELQRLLELDPNGRQGTWARDALKQMDNP